MKPPHRRFRTRFWVEITSASIFGALFVLTLFWRDWIEAFGIEPDNHDGTAEWLLVAVLFVVFAVSAVCARSEWRRTAPAR
ncbi:ABC transporter permease [Micromonospora sp. NBS 11-29]|uniref:ABC transporter permease n=1 Tax=Micromonospora sp. NBS 11-29 TaxID=1960879 RepID=UPI000B78A5EE|nr:ABC transporter permease [Micromonospora sp. NBS 11-29]